MLQSELKRDLEEIASKNRILQQELETRSHHVNYLEAEKRLLEAKYDDLERTYKQVTVKYAKDLERFEKWKKWLWHEVETDNDLDENSRAKKWAMTFMHRRKKLTEKGTGTFDDDVPELVDRSVMETPKPSTKRSKTSTVPTPSPLTTTTKTNCESSPTVMVPSPCAPGKISASIPNVQVTPVKDFQTFDTEDSSQDKQASHTSDSATEDESFPDSVRVTPPKSVFSPSAQSKYLKRTQHITTNTERTDGESRYSDSNVPLWGFEPPLKRRKVTESSHLLEGSDTPSGSGQREDREDPFNAKVTKHKPSGQEKGMSMSIDRENKAPAETATSSPNQMPHPPTTTASTLKKSSDYSAYKGRGRYAPVEVSNDEDRPLNELFVVDANQNQGLDYEFDNVVRGKERKRLLAGDCEECREYYEASGPKPPRLQPPPWRSPASSPVKDTKRTSCHHKGKGKGKGNTPETMPESPTPQRRMIDSHRQEISRHRAQWERGKTPPGYWGIGFPTTQEVQDINEKAKEIHRQKFKAVQREALNGNGRYRRR
ncbi:hypothetical protein E1B28_005818 [Marasmius oreades]|nr:uncharacterized protein E1B28_005818 [Marasmius oreades]KAG7095027.1 hypothetical protein E1B28_005818 [Marasmius oreades]